jgi:hypothetical protein
VNQAFSILQNERESYITTRVEPSAGAAIQIYRPSTPSSYDPDDLLREATRLALLPAAPLSHLQAVLRYVAETS